MDSTKIDMDGVQYHVEMTGQGRPLLLLHGFTGSSASWRSFANRLAQTFRVICVDLPGHGQTAAPDNAARFEMQPVARDLITIMQTLGFARFGLHGYSMGGRLALYTALHYPENIAALSLESASPGLAGSGEREARMTSDDALAQRIVDGGIPAFVDHWESIPLFASHAWRLDEATRNEQRAIRLANRGLGLANSLKGMGTGIQPSLWERLGALQMPALLMTGQEDTKFERINAKMAEKLPDAARLSIHSAGHTVHLEQPEAWHAAVNIFHRYASKTA